jgi:hypothetical protein
MKRWIASLSLGVLVLAGSASAGGIATTPLRGAYEVPARDTRATGFVKLKLNHDGTKLQYVLHVSHIENVVMVNIHLASAGHNGAAVAVLFGPAEPAGGRVGGRLASGTITAGKLVGPLSGEPLSALIAAIRTGTAYVNVLTNSGERPEDSGPGNYLAGEIRGQIKMHD